MSTEPDTPLAELFATDPLKLNDRDIDSMVTALRGQYKQFMVSDNKTVGKPETRKSAAQKTREKNAKVIDKAALDDLLGGL